jgi:hypothetical protein
MIYKIVNALNNYNIEDNLNNPYIKIIMDIKKDIGMSNKHITDKVETSNNNLWEYIKKAILVLTVIIALIELILKYL